MINTADDSTLLSIIVTNYNYGQFVSRAIESALAITNMQVQVVVVDDGSTDSSREVIESYGDRVVAIYKANGGQASAFNAGFRIAKGRYVLFLDADDELIPSAVVQAVSVCSTGYIKVSGRMRLIGDAGVLLGYVPPEEHEIATGHMSNRLLKFSLIGCVPTSGNVFNRMALSAIFPIDERYRICADSELLYGAAQCGDSGCISVPIGNYFIHGSNNFAGAGFLIPPGAKLRSRLYGIYSRLSFCRKAAPGNISLDEVILDYMQWGLLVDLLLASKFSELNPLFDDFNVYLRRRLLWRGFIRALRREKLSKFKAVRVIMEVTLVICLPRAFAVAYLRKRDEYRKGK